jgi:hypothetical protein
MQLAAIGWALDPDGIYQIASPPQFQYATRWAQNIQLTASR